MTRFARLSSVLATAVVALCGWVALAGATIVKQLSVADMTRRADVIVQGTVVRQSAAWDEAHARIYTITEIQVAEALKGGAAPGAIVAVRQLGGVADGIVQSIPGNARFAAAEEVLVFLDRDETLPWHYVIGMAQGKYTVSKAGGAAQVAPDVHDLAFVRPNVGGALTPVDATPQMNAATALGDFKRQIQSALLAP